MTRTTYPEILRVEARQKVRGEAIYGSDQTRANMAHGVFAVATIGRGELLALDVGEARSLPGTLLILTHEDMEGIQSPGFLMTGGAAFQSLLPMLSPRIAYRGQPIALVLADSYAAAQEGAMCIRAQ